MDSNPDAENVFVLKREVWFEKGCTGIAVGREFQGISSFVIEYIIICFNICAFQRFDVIFADLPQIQSQWNLKWQMTGNPERKLLKMCVPLEVVSSMHHDSKERLHGSALQKDLDLFSRMRYDECICVSNLMTAAVNTNVAMG